MRALILRNDLCNLVWSKPVTKIAQDYDVSDSAIIKICKKMEIPKPGRGYWVKVECGKKVKVTPLPKLSKKGVDRYYLWNRAILWDSWMSKANHPCLHIPSVGAAPEFLRIASKSFSDVL